MRKKVKKVYLVILVVLAFMGSSYYAGEIVAFANSVRWHNENHPLTLLSGKDGKVIELSGIKIGDYYLDNNFHNKLYLNTNLESKESCSICQGKENKSFIVKMIWSWYNIKQSKNLSQR